MRSLWLAVGGGRLIQGDSEPAGARSGTFGEAGRGERMRTKARLCYTLYKREALGWANLPLQQNTFMLEARKER